MIASFELFRLRRRRVAAGTIVFLGILVASARSIFDGYDRVTATYIERVVLGDEIGVRRRSYGVVMHLASVAEDLRKGMVRNDKDREK